MFEFRKSGKSPGENKPKEEKSGPAGLAVLGNFLYLFADVPVPGKKGDFYELCTMAPDTTNTQTVTVKVLPALRAYILAVNNDSDIILPSRESRLWGLVKMHLATIPPDYKPTPAGGDESCIRIGIYKTKRQEYNRNARRVIYQETLFRDYLTPAGQKAIADYLTRYFKQTFRSYMSGALGNNDELSIHDAIHQFCTLYKINMDIITYEMLRKDWFRFRRRHPAGYVIPIENKDF